MTKIEWFTYRISRYSLFFKALKYVREMLGKPETLWYQTNVVRIKRSLYQLIFMHFASELFYDFCHSQGAYGSQQIDGLLTKGIIPAEIINYNLENQVGHGSSFYSIVRRVYMGQLSAVAEAELQRMNQICHELDTFMGFLEFWAILQGEDPNSMDPSFPEVDFGCGDPFREPFDCAFDDDWGW